ncbi:MAG: hypothetical protein HXY18_08815 [Bryobacteraceae bacterium]|nr:hypothetical protein [Bryobacteraceae bacterium]
MNIPKPWALAASAASAALAAFGLWWVLESGPSPADLVAELPEKTGATLFVDLGLARRTGVLAYFTAPAAAQDPEYRGFVEATGFDYSRDLDRLAVRFAPGGVWIAASGRFDGRKLATYATARGGRCIRGLCTMQGSTPERQISWLHPPGRLLRMAVSPDPMAAALSGSSPQPVQKLPSSPLWLQVPGTLLRPAEGLPPGVSALLSALSGAREAVFRLSADKENFTIRLEAPFADAAAAQTSVEKLSSATELLRKLIAREKQPPADRGLAGILASGEFRAEGSTAAGAWRVRRELLKSLAGQS